MEPDHLAKKFRTKRSINKREAPYVIYPEILVIVDYDGYRYINFPFIHSLRLCKQCYL